jgi:hypothetical protein
MHASLVATLVLVISTIAPALSVPLGYVFVTTLNLAISSDLSVVLEMHLPDVTPRETGISPPPLEMHSPDVPPRETGISPPPLEIHLPDVTPRETGISPPPLEMHLPDVLPRETGISPPPLEMHLPDVTPRETGTSPPPRQETTASSKHLADLMALLPHAMSTPQMQDGLCEMIQCVTIHRYVTSRNFPMWLPVDVRRLDFRLDFLQLNWSYCVQPQWPLVRTFLWLHEFNFVLCVDYCLVDSSPEINFEL